MPSRSTAEPRSAIKAPAKAATQPARRRATAVPKGAAKAAPGPGLPKRAKPGQLVKRPDSARPDPKPKLVRDSFTMPQADFGLVGALKERALEFKRPTKKSELLRAGLQALAKLDNQALRSALDALTPLKPGRPKKAD